MAGVCGRAKPSWPGIERENKEGARAPQSPLRVHSQRLPARPLLLIIPLSPNKQCLPENQAFDPWIFRALCRPKLQKFGDMLLFLRTLDCLVQSRFFEDCILKGKGKAQNVDLNGKK
jgi:hypothetical protein